MIPTKEVTPMSPGLRLCALHLAFFLCLNLIPTLIPPADVLFAEPETETEVPAADLSGMDDVSPDDWFYVYVRVGYRHGFLHGQDGKFEPNRSITRAEFITILGRLHRALGGYVEYEASPAAEAFHTPYLRWANELDLIEGNEHGHFRPDEPILRAEIAVILMRYLNVYSLYDHFLDQYEHHSENFADADEIPSWAVSPARLLRNFGIMQGIHNPEDPEGVYYFLPDDEAIRSEAATIFARMFITIFDGTVAA